MNRISAKYGSKIVSRHPIQKIEVKIDNCKVGIESNLQEFCVQI